MQQRQHAFGELLAQYRARKSGLTQARLASLSGYDQSILVRMSQGKKDLTGPSGRERVVRLIETLADLGALATLDEADALLLAADMPPLFERHPSEARLITRLSRLPAGQRVRRTNLPAPLTHFIGRTQEIAEARQLLGMTRLLTLTGAGGCGKTRLAQRIAADVLIAYSEGVWYAELATLTDPALVPEVIARALGLVPSDQPAQERVMDYLRERQVLLVLDNCEHLIGAVASFSVAILRACPRVTILTTSREVLNEEGETAWRVPPMQPDEAGRLFADRGAARSYAHLSAQDNTVLQICQRLDGMPLAIELAAARLGTLSLSELAARLDNRFEVLVSGRRTALPRHQTLRALIDWSYDSLGPQEKLVFQQLSVFVGGWELQQAEIVISGTLIHRADVNPALAHLVDKSLVLLEFTEGIARYRLLETLREYALAKLAETGELEATRLRHAEALLHLAEASTQWLHGPQQGVWRIRLEQQYPNLQAAMEWCFESKGNALIGCRIAAALYHFWQIASGHYQDVRKWVMLANKSLTGDMPPAVQAWILLEKNYYFIDIATGVACTRRVHDLFVEAGDLVHAAMVKLMIGEMVYYAMYCAQNGVHN